MRTETGEDREKKGRTTERMMKKPGTVDDGCKAGGMGIY